MPKIRSTVRVNINVAQRGQMLVRDLRADPDTDHRFIVPWSRVRPGEKPEDTVRRIFEKLGIKTEELNLIDERETPVDSRWVKEGFVDHDIDKYYLFEIFVGRFDTIFIDPPSGYIWRSTLDKGIGVEHVID